jgi:HK97 family phage portal protein
VNLGLFDIFKRKITVQMTQAQVLDSAPLYSLFGRDVYSSDVVQQAIGCIVSEMKKLRPQHVRKGSADKDTVSMNSTLQRVLDSPNGFMTTSDFIEKIVWNLFLDYNSFVLPDFDVNKDGTRTFYNLLPVRASSTDFIEDAGGELYVKFTFADSKFIIVPYGALIHIRHNYSLHQYKGGDAYGLPDHKALGETLNTNRELWNGISKSIKSGMAINGVIKYNTLLDKDKMDGNIKDLVNRLKNNDSGFLPMDLKGEFIPFSRDVKFVDADTLKFIDEKILRTFGVPLSILTGDYTKDQYEAFYQKTIEPLLISFGQAFSRALFTPRELGFGNKIAFYSKEALFMTTEQKLEAIRLLGDSGTLFENEKRILVGLDPLPDLENKRMASLNYIDVDLIDSYQTNRLSGAGGANGSENDTGNDGAIEVEAANTLNGAQIKSLIEIIQLYADGTLTLEQAINLVAVGIGISGDKAKQIILGEDMDE